MKGLFIPEITAEMFRNGCLESIEALMAEGEIYDIDYDPEQHWIPCSERLPEEGREVLTCLTDWKTGEQRRVVSYRIDFNMWHGYGRYNEKCVAWMPMPEPWRGDAE